MFKFLYPTQIKIVIALIIGVSSFLASGADELVKDKIWKRYGADDNKEAILDSTGYSDGISQRVIVTNVKKVSSLEVAKTEYIIWLERLASLGIYALVGYLVSCIILLVIKHEN